MLIKGLLLTLYILRWSLELLLIYIEVPVPSHQNTSSWFWNCSQSVVGFFWFFYILSPHLDHLQQLDNLEQSAHLYGQLTTVGCFKTFGQFTTIWSFTRFELLTILWSFTIFGPFTTFENLQHLDHSQYLDHSQPLDY
jgi:hypothetical protein